MQKYRKWTDQATGVNPFIIADQKKHNLLYNISTIVKSLFIQLLLLSFSPLILLATLLPFLSFFNKIILTLGGNVTQYDDNKFTNDLSKIMKKKTKIILSNFTSVFDVFYFMFKIPGVKFLIVHQNSQSDQYYQITQGISCLIRLLTKRQPFYQYHSEDNLQSKKYFKSLNKVSQVIDQSPLLIFYELIKTNGLGTIKISKTLVNQLYQIEKDYMIAKISYAPRDELYFNMVRGPILNFWRSLGSFSKRSLKARSQITEFQNIHSSNELKKDIDEFMSTNGSKLLQTNARDYQNFIDFFFKTQKNDYVHQTK